MTKKDITICLSNGMEVSPVAMLVQVASRFDSSIYIETEGKRVKAKSIMGMMSMGLNKGEQITVFADGADEEQAVEGVEKFLLGNE